MANEFCLQWHCSNLVLKRISQVKKCFFFAQNLQPHRWDFGIFLSCFPIYKDSFSLSRHASFLLPWFYDKAERKEVCVCVCFISRRFFYLIRLIGGKMDLFDDVEYHRSCKTNVLKLLPLHNISIYYKNTISSSTARKFIFSTIIWIWLRSINYLSL